MVQGRVKVDSAKPRAKAVCERCGFHWNHYMLKWQMDWRGPAIQNIGILVCPRCTDEPQQNGQRTIILPPDPESIRNARVEPYVLDTNPLSPIGMTMTDDVRSGGMLGNMTFCGGVLAAFNGTTNKPYQQCAAIAVSNSSFNNWVGKNWSPALGGLFGSSLGYGVHTHSLSSFTAHAPNDQSFLSSAPVDWLVQGSPNAVSWFTLSSGTTQGIAGETIAAEPGGSPYQFHRLAFGGDGVSTIALAQVTFSVTRVSS